MKPRSVADRLTDILAAHPDEWFTPHQLHTEYTDRYGPATYETIRRNTYRIPNVNVRKTPHPGRGHPYTIAIQHKEPT